MRRSSVLVLTLALLASLLGVAVTATTASADPLAPAPVASNPAPLPNELFSLSGNLGVPNRSLELQYKSGSSWKKNTTNKTDATGAYTVYSRKVTKTQQFRVYAKKSGSNPAVYSDVVTVTPVAQTATLSIVRDCTGNDCSASTATVKGTFTPVREGRLVAFQHKSGSKWVQIGSKVPQGADGTVTTSLSLTGLPQWTTRSYRLVADPVNGSDPATSAETKFMPGPTQLGANVLRISVAGGAYPTSKSKDYTAVVTASTNGDATGTTNLTVEKFGVRGSSTSGYTKKPYKLKFDSGLKLFGMKKSKSWTMLASFLDQSFIRDKVGLDLGRAVGAKGGHLTWTPDSRFAEVFVNDQYVGSYLVTESVKIDKDRVDVDAEQGMIMETDGTSVASSKLGFLSSTGKIAFAFKDPDEYKTGEEAAEGVTSAKLAAIKSRVNAFESVLYGSNRANPVTGYAKYVDVASAVDFYLVKEFMKDNDADFYRSNYFTWDPSLRPGKPLSDDKFHFGPVWDFDRSSGNVSDTDAPHKYVSSPQGWYNRGTGTPSGRKNYKTHWFVQLFKDPAFDAAVKARWLEVRDDFLKVSQTQTAAYKAQIGVGADNDRARWKSETKRYKARGTTYADEVDYVTGWYLDRYTWMNGQLTH